MFTRHWTCYGFANSATRSTNINDRPPAMGTDYWMLLLSQYDSKRTLQKELWLCSKSIYLFKEWWIILVGTWYEKGIFSWPNRKWLIWYKIIKINPAWY